MSDAPPVPELDLTDPDAVAQTLREAARLFRDCPLRRGSTVHLPDAGHVIVTGDLHDHQLNFQRILKLAALDPAAPPPPHSRGSGQGPRHLILHEVIHGPDRINNADLSIRMLTRCAALKCRFPDQVHVLLSNHELAQMQGEGITKHGVSVVDAFDLGVEYLYGDGAEDVQLAVEEYVRSLPLAVRCANRLMVCHSLPAPRRIDDFDKSIVDRPLVEEDYFNKASAYDMVWGRYQNATITAELAQAWDVDAFILGHQPAEMGYETLAHNALIIASDHNHGVALSLDLARHYRRDDLVHGIRALAGVTV